MFGCAAWYIVVCGTLQYITVYYSMVPHTGTSGGDSQYVHIAATIGSTTAHHWSNFWSTAARPHAHRRFGIPKFRNPCCFPRPLDYSIRACVPSQNKLENGKRRRVYAAWKSSCGLRSPFTNAVRLIAINSNLHSRIEHTHRSEFVFGKVFTIKTRWA